MQTMPFNQYQIVICGNVELNRRVAEISCKSASGPNEVFIGIVYENEEGWIVEHENREFPLPQEIIDHAKSKLSNYVNRKGISEADQLTRAGHSLLLMLKNDGTAMGRNLEE